MSVHESAGELILAHEHLKLAADALSEARRIGKWDNYRTGDDSARNALRDIHTPLVLMTERLERIIWAASKTKAGEALTLK